MQTGVVSWQFFDVLGVRPILGRGFAEDDEKAGIAYVGDSITADVEGARDAGLRAVWLDRWNDPWAVPADVVRIRSLLDLLDLLEPC